MFDLRLRVGVSRLPFEDSNALNVGKDFNEFQIKEFDADIQGGRKM